jgi:hypothetical protein
MKKLIAALIISSPLLFTGCTVDTVAVNTVAYDPGYSNDYVYSVGYYNNRPYWGNNYYYPGYNWGANGYWGGGYYNGY